MGLFVTSISALSFVTSALKVFNFSKLRIPFRIGWDFFTSAFEASRILYKNRI
jgi:hypothetical protein